MPWSLRILTTLGFLLMGFYPIAALVSQKQLAMMREQGAMDEMPHAVVLRVESAPGDAVLAMLLLLPALVGAFRRDRIGYFGCLTTAWGFTVMKAWSWVIGWGPIMLLSYLPVHCFILWLAGGDKWRRYFAVRARQAATIGHAPWRRTASAGLWASILALVVIAVFYQRAKTARPYLDFREFGAHYQPLSEMQSVMYEQMQQFRRGWER